MVCRVVTEIPMVDQGPKGYCVPATWERYLRYMDVPADLYVLALMGHTGLGGFTNYGQMTAGMDDYVSAYHRRIENFDAPLDVLHVQKYIDEGLPLMWTCWLDNSAETHESFQRKLIVDPAKYAEWLKRADNTLDGLNPVNAQRTNGHMRLIVGYNIATNEIGISDSWGARGAERWVSVDTANKINQGYISYLSW